MLWGSATCGDFHTFVTEMGVVSTICLMVFFFFIIIIFFNVVMHLPSDSRGIIKLLRLSDAYMHH